MSIEIACTVGSLTPQNGFQALRVPGVCAWCRFHDKSAPAVRQVRRHNCTGLPFKHTFCRRYYSHNMLMGANTYISAIIRSCSFETVLTISTKTGEFQNGVRILICRRIPSGICVKQPNSISGVAGSSGSNTQPGRAIGAIGGAPGGSFSSRRLKISQQPADQH